MTKKQKIGCLLRQQLTISKMSQQKFADIFPADLSSVKRWLKGECLTFETVERIENIFEIQIIDILI